MTRFGRDTGGERIRLLHTAGAVAVGVTAGHRTPTTALQWAATQAARRGAPLHLVHVINPSPCGNAAAMVSCAYLPPALLAMERDVVTHELGALATQARAAHAGLDTIVDVLDGEPALTLVDLSNAGEQLVLCPAPRHPALAAIQGSSGSVPLAQLRRPVVFVGRHKARQGPVVAVIHGLRDVGPVLTQAMDFAAERDCGVEVLALPLNQPRRSSARIAGYEAALFDVLTDFRAWRPGIPIITARVVPTAQQIRVQAQSAGALLVIGVPHGATPTAVMHRHRVRRLIRAGSTAVCVVPIVQEPTSLRNRTHRPG